MTTIRRDQWTVDDIRNQVETSRVVLFGRGDEESPRCGYTANAIEAVRSAGTPYELIDVANQPSANAALRAYAGPVHLPVVYIDGELVGSSDNLSGLIESGELGRRLGR